MTVSFHMLMFSQRIRVRCCNYCALLGKLTEITIYFMNIQSINSASALSAHNDIADANPDLDSATINNKTELPSSTASTLSNSQTHYNQNDFFNSGAKNPLESQADQSTDTTTPTVLKNDYATAQSLPVESQSNESHEHCDVGESLHDESSADSRSNFGGPEVKTITEDGITYTANETEWVRIQADGVTLNMTTDSESDVPVNFGLAVGDNNTINGTRDTDLIGLVGSHNVAHGDCGDDFMTISGGTRNQINGGYDEDTMHIYSGNFNSAFGGDGDDTLTSHSGTNWLLGGSGNDVLRVYGEQPELREGGSIRAWAVTSGGGDDDKIYINNSTGSSVYGDSSHAEYRTDGNDTIKVSNSTDIELQGRGGNDVFNIDSLSTDVSADGGSGTDIVKIDKPLNPTAFTVESVTHLNEPYQKVSGSGEPGDFILVKNLERIEYNNGALIFESGAWIVE